MSEPCTFPEAYATTRFRAPTPPPQWPSAFAIITAHNPDSTARTDAENAAADRELRAELADGGCWFTRITGFAPDKGHSEEGWAARLSVDEARGLGRAFRQLAVFYVQDDVLTVHCCADPAASETIGRFSERLDPAGH